MTGAYDKVSDQIRGRAGPGCANHDSPSPDDVHNQPRQLLLLFEIKNSSKINFACMHLTWSPSQFLLDKLNMSIWEIMIWSGAHPVTPCAWIDHKPFVCSQSVGWRLASKRDEHVVNLLTKYFGMWHWRNLVGRWKEEIWISPNISGQSQADWMNCQEASRDRKHFWRPSLSTACR